MSSSTPGNYNKTSGRLLETTERCSIEEEPAALAATDPPQLEGSSPSDKEINERKEKFSIVTRFSTTHVEACERCRYSGTGCVNLVETRAGERTDVFVKCRTGGLNLNCFVSTDSFFVFLIRPYCV